jgi:hypothetical protein
MVLVCVDEGLEGEQAILAAKSWSAAKLKFGSVEVQ